MKRFIFILALFSFTVSVLAQSTYYVNVRSANARSCAKTSCAIVTKFARGAQLAVNQVVTGDRVSGSTNWLEITYNGQLVYVHASLATTTAPASTSSGSGSSNTTTSPIVTPNSSQAPATTSICNGARTCGQMASCEQAYACLNDGRSSLDRDSDGVPCESICPGG